MKMLFIKKILVLFITSITFWGCQSSMKKFRIPQKAEINKEKKYEDCITYKHFLEYNKAKECVYESYECLGNGKGLYCVYSQCELKVDTIISIEFVSNPDYIKPPNDISITKWKKENYLYIAEGEFFVAKGHEHRTRFVLSYVFVEENFLHTDFVPVSFGPPTQWGYFAYWGFGEQRGILKNGFRSGEWKITGYETSSLTETITITPLYFKEICTYKQGKKNGRVYQYAKTDLNNLENWEQSPSKSINYENGIVEGWLYEYDSMGQKIDSTLYKNNEEVR
jgi:hypothetical protein